MTAARIVSTGSRLRRWFLRLVPRRKRIRITIAGGTNIEIAVEGVPASQVTVVARDQPSPAEVGREISKALESWIPSGRGPS